MKKFMVFISTLVALIVVVCLGLTTYYFMRNDESIAVNTKEIYVNVGDIITLDELDIEIKKPHKKTTFDYNAGGDKVTSLVKFEQGKGHYEVKGGGETQIVIKTSNSRCPEFKVSIHIGNGSAEYPYYVEDAADLSQIGSAYALDAHYSMVKDVPVSELQPIGYDYATETWVGFSGVFNGNGHIISGLKQTNGEYTNAGLFYSLNGATVENLIITNATITGEYASAGVLAGEALAQINSVAVLNSSITTSANNSFVGGLVGKLSDAYSKLSVSYADKVNINLNGENAVVGGLVGELNLATVQATYANGGVITAEGAHKIGGLVGEFVIDAENGAILESYSTITSENANFASFISTIATADGFVNADANVLRYLAGNMAVGTTVVKTYDNTFFTTFYEADSYSLYFIRNFATLEEMAANDEFVYYALHSGNKTPWDRVWNTESKPVPTLNLGSSAVSSLSTAYLKKNIAQENIGNSTQLLEFLNGTVTDKAYGLTGDINLGGAEVPAVNLVNSVLNGNGYTISNFKISNGVVDGNQKYFGLISSATNSSIYDLNLDGVVVDVASANENIVVGGVVGHMIDGADVRNVKVTISNVNTDNVTMSHFGGIVGVMDNNTTLADGVVTNIALNNSKIAYVGGAVAENNGLVQNCQVGGVEVVDGEETSLTVAKLSGMNAVGGVGAINNGSIVDSKVNVEITNSNHNSGVNTLNMGAVAATNSNEINNVQANAKISVVKTENTVEYSVGGAVAVNAGNLQNVTLTGEGVTINANVEYVAHIGGVAANNSGSINNVYNYLTSLGLNDADYVENPSEEYANKNVRIGGVVDINTGSIEEVVTTSNINGNIVAGVVVEQDSASASVNKVLVGKFNAETKEITDNEIKGSVYVAGVVYRLMQGTVENVQTSTALEGMANEARVSLVVLEFPTNASLRNSAINNSLAGVGTFYRESWCDYTTRGTAGHYNIYVKVSAAGSMQSVVINTEKARVNSIKYKQSNANRGIVNDYSNSSRSSYIRDVNNSEFANAATFKGNFTYTLTGGWFEPNGHNYTRNLTFDFDNVWSDTNGVNLQFLNK